VPGEILSDFGFHPPFLAAKYATNSCKTHIIDCDELPPKNINLRNNKNEFRKRSTYEVSSH